MDEKVRAEASRAASRTAVVLVVLAAAFSGVCAASASAAVHVVDFESFSAGTTVTNQDPTVTFGVPAGAAITYAPMVEAVASTRAHSGTKVASLSVCGGEFCTNRTDARLTSAAQSVSVYIGSVDVGASNEHVTLTVYDINGHVIGSDTQPISSTTGTHTELTVASFRILPGPRFVPNTNITGFTISSSDNVGGLAFDDLTYDVPATPPPPDFALNQDDTSEVNLPQAGASNVGFTIQRLNGSNGNISLAASGLPAGVNASFSPGTATGSTPTTTVNLHLTASPTAPPADALVTVTATPAAGAGTNSHSVSFPLHVVVPFDLRAKGIDVFQGVQSIAAVPTRGINGVQQYRGVELAAGGLTIVRLYADAVDADRQITNVDARLYGFDAGGNALPGSPLLPDVAPLVDPSTHDGLTTEDRVAENGAATFTLPHSWTRGTISLHGTLATPPVFANSPVIECTTPACLANNDVTLQGVAFTPVQNAVFTTVPIDTVVKPPSVDVGSPDRLFAATVAAAPFGTGQLVFRPYAAAIDDTAETKRGNGASQHAIELMTQDGDLGAHNGDYGIVGVARNLGGLTIGRMSVVEASSGRPLTSAAHEVFHQLGLQHAGSECGGGADNDADDHGQSGALWPPDGMGFLQSIGIDRQAGSGGSPSTPYRFIADTNAFDSSLDYIVAGVGSNIDQPSSQNRHPFDFMSYCANIGSGDPGDWLAVGNWERVLDRFAIGPAGSAVDANAGAPTSDARRTAIRLIRAPRAPSLHVVAVIYHGAIHIESVARGGVIPAGTTSNGYRFASIGTNHQVHAVRAQETVGHVDGPGGGPIGVLEAFVPGARVSEVELLSHGRTISMRRASRHLPALRLLSVRSNAKTITVRWRASDADHNRLSIAIDYSADGGRTWRTVYEGPNTGVVTLPSSFMARSRRAVVRVSVNDGFHTVSARSKIFFSRGAGPTLQLTSPTAGRAISRGADLTVVANAFDDSGNLLAGSQLRWFRGRHMLGTGKQLDLTALPAGVERLHVIATDQYGRASVVALSVRVLAIAPLLLQGAATRLAGKQIAVTLQSSIPAEAKITGRGVLWRGRAGRSTRVVRISLLRGQRPRFIHVLLLADGRLTVSLIRVR